MSLVITSQFRPFTYDEMVKPLVQYKEAYDKVEQDYSTLSAQTEMWKDIANQTDSPEAYARYKSYSDQLNSVITDFSKGMNINNRRALIGMKRRYYSDIQPIADAYKRKSTLAEEQRKAELANPTMLWERKASDMSLDEFINNPDAGYGRQYSGALIAQQVAGAASNLAKEARDSKEGKTRLKQILPYQYEFIQQNGFSSDAVMRAILGSPNAESILTGLVDKAIDTSGIGRLDSEGNPTGEGWGDLYTRRRAYDYARQGLWDAIGGSQRHMVTDTYSMKKQLDADEDTNKHDKGNGGDGSELYYRLVPKTTVDIDKETSQMNSDLQTLKEIIANPSLLEEESTRTITEPSLISPDPMSGFLIDIGTGRTREETYYPYRDKLADMSKRYGDIKYTISDGKLTGGNLEEFSQKLESNIRSSAVRSFSYKPNITQSDLIIQVLKENSRSYNRRSNKTGLWKLDNNKKGSEVDIDDLNKYFTSDADIDFDPDLGFIVNSTDSNGNTRSAILDTELFDDPNRTFSKAQQSIKIALDNGEDELAAMLIDSTMKAFHNKYNTLVKRQSNTFSK